MPFRSLLNSLARDLQGGAPGGAGGAGGYGYGAGGGGFGAGGYGGYGGFGQPPPAQVPQATVPCPRQQPQAGHQDWIGLNDPRFATFNICPTCYNSSIRPTPYASSFVTKGGALAPPPHVAVRCDMSRFWVKTAGLVLLTMNQDRQLDITLLARVAGIRAQEGDCPNAQLASEQQPLAVAQRTWYTAQDPQTGAQPLAGWTVCASCVLNIQACCPAIAAAFAPVQPAAPREASCAMVPSDRYDDARTMEMLQQIGGCAVTAALMRRPSLSQLVDWLRANPPRQRGGGGGGPVPGLMGGAQPQGNGLCPRNYPSTTLRCHTMQGLFDFTVCEQCYADVIKPDANRGVQLAGQFDPNPSVMPSGFTCQLYSDRMRRVWSETVSSGNLEHLRQKVNERRTKERELQMKTAQLQQQAAQLRIQAQTKEHLAINSFRAANSAASNNIMLAGVGVSYRIDSMHVAVPSGVPDHSQFTQLNNQAAMLKVQAGQAEDQIKFAEEEWRRYWE